MGTLCRGRRSYENSPCWEDRARGTPRSVSPRCGSPREHVQDPHPGRRPYKSSLCLGSVCDHSPTAGCSVGCSEAALGGCAHWGPFRTGSGAVQHSMCYVRKRPCARLCAVCCSACMFLCRSCMCNAVSTRSGTQLLATCVCVSACMCLQVHSSAARTCVPARLFAAVCACSPACCSACVQGCLVHEWSACQAPGACMFAHTVLTTRAGTQGRAMAPAALLSPWHWERWCQAP